jgi:hypothetical protein
MSNLIHHAQRVQSALSDPSLTNVQRLLRGIELLRELEAITESSAEQRRSAPELGAVRAILERSDTASTGEDTRSCDAALQEARELLQATIEAQLDRIVAAFNVGTEMVPANAIREARNHRELMIPRLSRVLRDMAANALSGQETIEMAPIYAALLISEFNATEAFPALLETIMLPDDAVDYQFGDFMCENAARILAHFAGETPDVIDSIIENRELNEVMRWGAVGSYCLLVRDQRVPRSEAVTRLRGFLRRAIELEDVTVIATLVHELSLLGPQEAKDEITAAFDSGLVNGFLADRDRVEQNIAEGEAALQRCFEQLPPTAITDTIAEAESFITCGRKPATSDDDESNFGDSAHAIAAPHVFAPPPYQPERVPVFTAGPRVGRNDPCPCGSGKKYKKCCLKADRK